MDAALIALAACLLTSFGGRAHLTISMLSGSLGRSPGLLVVSAATALLATLIAAALGAAVSGQFVGEARQMIVVGALLLAAIELAVSVTLAHPREPTRSLGAIGLVLFARQLIDAPRLCIFCICCGIGQYGPRSAGRGYRGCVGSYNGLDFFRTRVRREDTIFRTHHLGRNIVTGWVIYRIYHSIIYV